ncbi:LysR family transcriptional regulator [Enteractinococcus helveticum]|uniref:LysR family transcriptional regulator n=1 Tax=Enteractinococcus helveticum TaxID=1837282 RepID=A0A1B7M203_9MICC|nr:LysR family transcriptional regulator [Enteractinococcus helveticum]OAV62601.1 LysR family transcriptional regulator [Enteractinococcus helveticum]
MPANSDKPARKDVTLTQLKYFITAAAHRSMTGAAAELYIAQSAVSTAIAQLEHTLGVQLFIRQPSKGLALTISGEQLLKDARSLLAQLDELTENVRTQDTAVEGVLRLACFVTLAPFILPQLISELGNQHPNLRIEVFEADFDETSKMLLDGTVEAALTYDFGAFQGVTFKRLYHSAPHVILPADTALARQEKISLSSLQGWDMVLLDIPHSREYFLSMLEAANVKPHIRHSSRSYETVRSLVARGHGFSILNNIPKSNSTYDGGQLRAIPIADDYAPSLDVCLTHPADVRPSARTRAVATIATELMQGGNSSTGTHQ